MDPKTYELLNSVPEHADYAVTAGDLDPEDIPPERIGAVLNLLRHTNNKEEHFLAAKLLTSWGLCEGLVALEGDMEKNECIEGAYPHRLYGYDDTYHQIILAVTRYFANVADRGGTEAARTQIYSPLSKIISLASSKPFEIAKIFDFVKRKNYLEYVPLIEVHLVAIIDHPELHRWKIFDAIEFLMDFRPDFVLSLLQEKKKSIDDFRHVK
ncbi:hypothetical protein [Pseudomonas sp. Q1]|uniref:hypothetical protein n=1 Tax=Pseudomonas sp. Q1 TaxID=2202823 RepID=UPI001374EAC3|nr:hypothetical protein [Pseudomonas sp. Q1]NCE85621.1 hypothetical protein [Pseudomonas sp. Q1]